MSRHEDDSRQPLLLTEKKAAELLGFSQRTLQGWRSSGGPGLPFVRISKGCVRYRRCDIEAWIENQVRTSTADDAARGTILRKPREEG
jgi:predicted DNA-binding transcriptional regulator AlpA